MGYFRRKNKDGNLRCDFSHVAGINDIPPNFAVRVVQNDAEGRLEIKQLVGICKPIYLRYSQITAIGTVRHREIVEKSKSVLGRAMIGGLVLGPVGGVVGGISGLGTDKQTLDRNCLVINYHPSYDENATEAILLAIVGASMYWKSFVEELHIKTNIVPKDTQYL